MQACDAQNLGHNRLHAVGFPIRYPLYETDMAEGLKAMALEGHGVAFLPASAVKKDLRARRLVAAEPDGQGALSMTLDIRAYRQKPLGKEAGKSSVQELWSYLSAH